MMYTEGIKGHQSTGSVLVAGEVCDVLGQCSGIR